MSERREAARPVLLVTGGRGQVGFELVRELAPLGDVVAPPRDELDLADVAAIRRFVRRVRPQVILNAGAYTAVDKAESERALCFTVNAHAPGVLAEEAKLIGSALIHFSTDYVFDGASHIPYLESDIPAPINVYGESKLAGERAIEAVGGSSIILRTSWVYGLRGHNFLLTMLRMAREREELRIVGDQVGSPTWSRSIATATAQLLARISISGDYAGGVREHAGTYHMAASGSTSWHAFAQSILALDQRRNEHRCAQVVSIPTLAYPTAAARPRWSVLNCDKLANRVGLHLPAWDRQLELVMEGAVTA